jgi:serine/threonine protein phosphatase PrpC
VVASDGLWDVVTAFQLRELVKKHTDKTGSLEGVSRALIATAQQRASRDNITVIVLAFR